MPNNVKNVPLAPTPTQQWHQVPPVVLPPNSGEWIISFRLTGDHSENVTFNQNDPFWVREGRKPAKTIKEHPQIIAKHVTANGKELIVLNRNNNPEDEGPVELHYQLNFNGYPPLDPIIENGGGPRQLQDGFTATVLAIAVAVAFVGGIVASWGFRKLAS